MNENHRAVRQDLAEKQEVIVRAFGKHDPKMVGLILTAVGPVVFAFGLVTVAPGDDSPGLS